MNGPDVRDQTVFSLLERADTRPASRDAWWTLAVLAALGWLGTVAFIGRYRPNQVASLLYRAAPSETLFLGAIAATVLFAAVARAAGRGPLAGAALVVAAFLFGHQAYAWLHPLLPGRFVFPLRSTGDGIRLALARVSYAAVLLVPLLLAWWVAFGRQRDTWPRLTLGWGDFGVAGRDLSLKSPPAPWGRQLVGGYGVFCLVFFAVMQANVGFAPLRTGTLWGLLPAVLLAAVGNALAEELIFRGLLQPAFIRGGGVAAGLWVQGLMFGLMHWGLSVGILSALPVSLLIGLGSVVWGKAALDTRGIGWVVVAHAMVDVALMTAFFVPRTG